MRSGSGGRDSRPSVLDTGRSERGTSREELPVTQVGRYLLLKKLGEGGMGVVYSAYDPDLDRKVALKLLHSDGRTDPELARARLQREAQAMARISHPNVIPIFDVGVWGAQVFLAMELVDGGTLGSWMKEGQHPWRLVLEKYLDAGRGLQAAHAAGLVHRDFKPANVLMSREGRVYVTDFGLARQVGESGRETDFLPEEAQEFITEDRRMLEAQLTQSGLVMGTPNYMSPEQFQGSDLDARSDQFSFCVALYFALYGKRAFEPSRMRAYSNSSRLKAQNAARTDSLSEPTSPMRRQTAPVTPRGQPKELVQAEVQERIIQEPPRDVKLPGWVRDALMRGLELTPGARYPSMAALLDALSQEQRRLKRRNWVVGATAAAVGLGVVGGIVYQGSQVCADAGAPMTTTWSPDARQRLEASFLATELPFAQEMATRVSQTLDHYAESWRAQSVEACVATRKLGSQPEELFTRRAACLERRRQDLGALVGLMSQADPRLVERSLDAAHALPTLQECSDAEALADQQRLPSDPGKREEIARAQTELSEVKALLATGRLKVAAEKVQPLEERVQTTGYLPLLAELHLQQGALNAQMGKAPEATRLLTQALFDAEAGRADRLRAYTLIRLSFMEGRLKHYDQAESWAGLAEASLRRMGGDAEMLGDLQANRGTLAQEQKRFPEALRLLEEARSLRERALASDDPKNAHSSFNLGRLLVDMGDVDKGVEMLEKALVQTRTALGPQHPDVERRHSSLSASLRKLGRPGPALEHARAAAEIARVLFGEDSPQLAIRLDEIGMCLSDLKRHEEALKVYEQALAMKRKGLPPDDSDLSYSLDGVGQELLKLGRPQEAIAPLRASVAFEDLDPDSLAESNFSLARALWETGQHTEARAEAARARGQFEEAGLEPRVGDVDAWLKSLPPLPEIHTARHVRPKRSR
ncbi:serine/threonine-protein kinase [Archangium primigenium]|uniref:serine/threonine-protein kinase n=1 Tax=[Archangium] primigenium TaxID=2792470 RepID=UPI001EF998DD|nr:serine/threonine-protein kinase [Archangium primigenium]